MAKLYLSVVRPHLDYGAQVWHPYLSKDINALEKVCSTDMFQTMGCRLPGFITNTHAKKPETLLVFIKDNSLSHVFSIDLSSISSAFFCKVQPFSSIFPMHTPTDLNIHLYPTNSILHFRTTYHLKQ